MFENRESQCYIKRMRVIHSLALFLAALLFVTLSGCAPPDPEYYTPALDGYEGITTASGDSPAVLTYPGLTVDAPSSNTIEADGFLTLQGSVDGTESETGYALITLYRRDDATLSTSYFVKGDFTEDIWLRFGLGEYRLDVYNITSIDVDLEGEGAIWGYSYNTTPAYRFNVTNTRNEDGRYIYPSAFIQSDNDDLVQEALDIAAGEESPLDIARALHDYVVTYLYYDYDSLESGSRKKQDAVSVYLHGNAVCEGYTTLYNSLLRAVGIPAAYVQGETSAGLHAWSYVEIEGDWKYIDVTWDDPIWKGNNDYPDGENLSTEWFWLDELDDHVVTKIYSSRDMLPSPVPGPVKIQGYPPGWY